MQENKSGCFFLNTVYTMNIHERHVIMSGEYFQMCLDNYVDTSRSANEERPRDASCLLVVSFNSTVRRARSSVIGYFGFRFTATYN